MYSRHSNAMKAGIGKTLCNQLIIIIRAPLIVRPVCLRPALAVLPILIISVIGVRRRWILLVTLLIPALTAVLTALELLLRLIRSAWTAAVLIR